MKVGCSWTILAFEVTDASPVRENVHTQVEPVSSSLNTNDAFLLKLPQSSYIWKGKGMTQEEVAAAKVLSELIGAVPEEVEETSEPGESLNKMQQEKSMHSVS